MEGMGQLHHCCHGAVVPITASLGQLLCKELGAAWSKTRGFAGTDSSRENLLCRHELYKSPVK